MTTIPPPPPSDPERDTVPPTEPPGPSLLPSLGWPEQPPAWLHVLVEQFAAVTRGIVAEHLAPIIQEQGRLRTDFDLLRAAQHNAQDRLTALEARVAELERRP